MHSLTSFIPNMYEGAGASTRPKDTEEERKITESRTKRKAAKKQSFSGDLFDDPFYDSDCDSDGYQNMSSEDEDYEEEEEEEEGEEGEEVCGHPYCHCLHIHIRVRVARGIRIRISIHKCIGTHIRNISVLFTKIELKANC